MPRTQLGLFALLSVTFGISHASPGLAQYAERCVLDPNDPFDPGAVMFTGKYKGECLDTHDKRPAKILDQNEDNLVLANFYHRGRWWIAEVPRHGVKSVIYQIERFPTPVSWITAAHVELRFVMRDDSPIRLRPQSRGDTSPREDLRDLVLSFQHVAIPGKPYDLIRGELNDFAIAGRMMSTRDRAIEAIDQDHHTVHQLELRLADGDGDRLLWNAARASESLGINHAYNTLQKSCITELFDYLDATLQYPGKKVKPFRIEAHRVLDPVDGAARAALKKRGLTDEKSERETLNDERKPLPERVPL